jgi:hypothetical protein
LKQIAPVIALIAAVGRRNEPPSRSLPSVVLLDIGREIEDPGAGYSPAGPDHFPTWYT